jgi:vancomycin resistance protein YoaR
MTTITFPRRIITPVATPPARRSMLIGFLGTLAAGLLAMVAASSAIGITSDGEVLPGVRVGGIDIGGLDRAAAEARLVADLPPVDTGHALVVADGTEHTVTFAELGRHYEIGAMLDAAMDVGRGDGPIADAVARLRALARPTSVPVVVHAYDPAVLDRVSTEIARSVSAYPVEAYVDRETFEVRAAADGRILEAAAVRDAIAAAVTTTDPADVTLTLAVAPAAPIVSTEEAESAADAARAAVGEMTLVVPGAAEDEAPITIAADTVREWVTFGPRGAEDYAMQIDAAAVRAELLTLAETVDRDPVDARFTVAGAGLGGVVAGQDGRVLDVTASTDGIISTLGERATGAGEVTLTVDVTEPSLTTAAAEELLPQMRMVSSWTTNYVSNEGNGFSANISIPAWDLDGYNLLPGEWFSFWGGIGPVTVERGYRYGGAIINGRSTQGVALAGGICSTSTTLFNAAMRAGLEIGDRTAHFYYIDRYPVGLDATVSIFDDWVTDLTFRNDTANPIVIRGFGSPGQVTFQIWSVPTGRTVALSDPIIRNARSATETTQVDSSLAPGTARRVEYPHDGFQATVSRTVYGPDGEVIHQNTWFSDYRVVNGITLVGPAAAAPPPPDDADEAAEPPATGDPPADPPDESEA